MKDVCLFFLVKLHTQIRFFFQQATFPPLQIKVWHNADILNRNLFLRKPFMTLVPLRVHTLCGATAATSVQRATRCVLLLLLSSTISSNTRPPARHSNLQMELCTFTSVASVVPAHFPPSVWCCFCSPLHSLCIFAVCSNLFVFEQLYPLSVALHKTFKKKKKQIFF